MLWQWRNWYSCLPGHQPCALTNWAILPQSRENWRKIINVIYILSHRVCELKKKVCLLFYILATSKVITGHIPTCWYVCAHSWLFYSAASLEHQTAGTMTCYRTQSHNADTELTSPCPILTMLSARLWSDRYQLQSRQFDSTRFRTCELRTQTHDLRIPQSPRMGGGRSIHLATPTGRRRKKKFDIYIYIYI